MHKYEQVEDGRIDAYCWKDIYDEQCSVGIGHNIHSEFFFVNCGGDMGTLSVAVEDTPKLIKALQAAYDYKRSQKDGYK